ncbi:ABC transporter ATP-binding protein [Haematospirillum sp. 15-248]|uniref:ABC transporter ATP-binding protein n=1 Tax=Haematospirillum sp. 15-248 TaxID=2723107 RepID=UPI00143C67BA|nr:ABC transporter ATP-binding protein [Haematospirillum sp. 15-248]NKD87144.1 ABC transporter ATP-binding protein [Haematospirillum sp. 15-248]
MIRCHNLCLTFNHGLPSQKKALDYLSLDIPEGEFVTVIGSNGAGKSTLLNTLAGDHLPDHGHITIDEHDVTTWPTHQRASLVARVFQDPVAGTCGDMTLEENLALANGRGVSGTFRKALDKDLRDRFREALHRLGLGLENRLATPMESLSGGQRQSVSLLMATLRPSKILLLDEHTAALDPQTASMVMALSDRVIREHNLTALMVTHSMRHALDYGTRTIMLHEGRIVLDITGDERHSMTIHNLLDMFAKVRGEELDDDKLLLE